jgi:hypothetical protein
LVAAIIFFLASYFTSYYFTENPSIGERGKGSRKLYKKAQRDFHLVFKDTSLLRLLVQKENKGAI